MRKAAFLDRDGVINRNAPEGDYILHWEDMHILPGVTDAVALLNRSGYCTIVVTNQRCVAKGLISAAGVEALHGQMCSALAKAGATIDDVVFCPHDYDAACPCRKPKPGMLLSAAAKHGVDLARSWMIGDSVIDAEAGERAGCRTALIQNLARIPADAKAQVLGSSLLDIVRKILELDGQSHKQDAVSHSLRAESGTK